LPASAETISRKDLGSREDGNEFFLESAEQVPRERVLKYLPIGNYKWYILSPPIEEACSFHNFVRRSTIDVDTSNPNSPIARLEVVIDGKVSYRHAIKGSPILRSTTTELGSLVPAFKDMLLKIGVKPSTWF
jgi:alkaline phosphatase D